VKIKTCLLLSLLALSSHAADPTAVLFLEPAVKLQLGQDSQPHPEAPAGILTEHEWRNSKIFPGTIRKYWVYAPARLDPSKPAAVMVFQDGQSNVDPLGNLRATVVMDNLIARGEIPPMIGIFINSGELGETLPEQNWKARNRSLEYDTLSDAYARFLLEEILPEVAKDHQLTADPEQRAICGASSGGICAWTVAWQRPDAFRKVVSLIGTFVDIRGGDAYPGLIRKTPAKPIRAFFQEGIDDLDNEKGSWPLANMQLQAALKFAKYDHRFVWTHSGHTSDEGGAMFPEIMRWLWRKN
jgi:enterochelin esterase-like enzyme